MRTLLLNSDWSPLNFVPYTRALCLLLEGKAEIINMGDRTSSWEEPITTPGRAFEAPATMRMLKRVNRRTITPRFRKWVLFNRDGWRCQYCDEAVDWRTVSVEHVVPRSHGGPTTWRNCVTSCKRCNLRKANRTPAEAGMPLRRQPTEPKIIHFWEWGRDIVNSASWHPDWASFFPDSYRP